METLLQKWPVDVIDVVGRAPQVLVYLCAEIKQQYHVRLKYNFRLKML